MKFRLSWLVLLIATALACDFARSQTTLPTSTRPAASQPASAQAIPAPPPGYQRDRDRPRRRSRNDVAAATAPAATAPATAGGSSWNGYNVLASRNIFVQDRSRLRSRSAASQDSRDSDSYMILTGIAEQGSYRFAFIEDARTGATARLMAGQAVGKGQIKSVTLDGIEYENTGSVKTIFVGQNLIGETAGTINVSATSPAAGSQPSSAAAGDVNSVLERLRQRRAQEMKP